MIELRPQQYAQVASLFEQIEHNAALIFSVIDCKNPGRIFVDDADQPRVALVYPTDTFYFLGGDGISTETGGAVVQTLFNTLIPAATEKELVLFVFSENWRANLNVLLADRGVIQISRKILPFNQERFGIHTGWRERIPTGFTLSQVTESMAEKDPALLPLVMEETGRFGTCLLKDGEIASICSAVAVGRGEVEIDISTQEAYQGQGLATLTACAFIEESLARNLKPVWSCWPFRTASYALAKKLGFDDRPDVPAFYWSENG
jgi:RimJ/RimL family protein N-acetyltransferase